MSDAISVTGYVDIYAVNGDSTVHVYSGKNAFTDSGFEYLINHLYASTSNDYIDSLVMYGKNSVATDVSFTIATSNYKPGSKSCKFTGSFSTTIEPLTVENFRLLSVANVTYSTLAVSPFYKDTGTKIYLEWTISMA